MPTSKKEYQTEFYISEQGYFCISQVDGIGEETETLMLTPSQVNLIKSYLADETIQNQAFASWGDGLESEAENG